jgi:hypothetical protein
MRVANVSRAMRVVAVALGVFVLGSWASTVQATFHTFQIDELYSSPDGMVQFVELHEAFGFNGQQFFAGQALTSTQGATTRVFTFATDLPDGLTAGKRVLIATPGFAALGIVTPDYIVPAPFLFPGGGTLDFAAVDSLTYPALPADGVSSLDRSGTTGVNSPTNYAGETGSIGPPAPPAPPAAVFGIPALGAPGLVALALLLLAATVLIRRSR